LPSEYFFKFPDSHQSECKPNMQCGFSGKVVVSGYHGRSAGSASDKDGGKEDLSWRRRIEKPAFEVPRIDTMALSIDN
jgi:hypothetical protein